MSRLTGSPFHKPTPFQFPSPPDTDADIIGPAYVQTSSSLLGGHELQSSEPEPSPAYSVPTPESAGARFRKISSIAYHTSGLRESRERTPQRGSKAFVIIIPPAAFTQDHGQLGHTLSSGPRHRLSHGLLMPLFPTLYGQLAAIAREYNFPSTTGLCLYPHFVENGVTMTPRISDETWPFIWSHVFEATPAPRSPISGKIEFDIDVRQARWYASWMASSHRDYLDHPFSINPSVAPSAAHERGGSRTTFHDVEDHDESRFAAPATRHVPRKLSLVDRYETMSSRSESQPASRSALSPPEHAHVASQVLSPIVQEEEPKSARDALDSRVKSWRASAVLQPTPLAATGQTSLEPVNMPNMLPIEDGLSETPEEQINLADFTWSISSAGPPSDYTLPSPGPSVYRLPSPDIAHRMYEDMPPTPSTATSWGVPLQSPSSPFDCYRAPSVDLAERLVSSRPVTPSTATSWGPASCPSSPISSEYRSRSIHLADRADYSRPVTPSTATSWGAPLSYPPSPMTPFYVSTPDVGHRSFEDFDRERAWKHAPWAHSCPHAAASTCGLNLAAASEAQKRVPWAHSWPYTSHSSYLQHASTKFVGQHEAIPWAFSWPYRAFGHTSNEPTGHPLVRSPSIYPRLVIYQPVYPYFDLYPAVALAKDDSPRYPSFNLYPSLRLDASTRIHSWPHAAASTCGLNLAVASEAQKRMPYTSDSSYLQHASTNFVGQHEAIPWAFSWPYHAFGHTSNEPTGHSLVCSPSIYPRLVIYQPVYPYFDLYPAVALAKDDSPGYPSFNLYPSRRLDASTRIHSWPHAAASTCGLNLAVASEAQKRMPYTSDSSYLQHASTNFVGQHEAIPWEFSWPYHAFGHTSNEPTGHPLVRSPSIYPRLVIYQPVYPYFDLYPAVALAKDDPPRYPSFNLYPSRRLDASTRRLPRLQPVIIKLKPCYPTFDIYPAIYPESVYQIYPPVAMNGRPAILADAAPRYPAFDLFAAVYPRVVPYPPALGTYLLEIEKGSKHKTRRYPDSDLSISAHNARTTRKDRSSGYPDFNLYPPVKCVGGVGKNIAVASHSTSVTARAQYPYFDLYPAVYPYFDLYPAFDGRDEARSLVGYPLFILYPPMAVKPDVMSVKLTTYPVFNLYPAVYPAFDIYPEVEGAPVVNKCATRSGYPYFDLCPATSTEDLEQIARKPLSIRAPYPYPIFDLYPAVYPFIEVYPALPYTSNTSETVPPGYFDFTLYSPSASNVEPPLNLATHEKYHTFSLFGKMSEVNKGEKAKIINVKVEARYPAFDLYPAVYPYFNLWPDVEQPRMAPQVSKPSSRLTHSELHGMVMMERIGSTGSFFESSSHLPRKLVKSRDDLHHAVFPDDVVVTPSGTLGRRYPEVGSRDTNFSDLLARRRLSTLRPSSARLAPPAAPSPSRRLPQPPPTHGPRLSSAFDSTTTLDFEQDISPVRVSPNRRAPASRFPQDIKSHQLAELNRTPSLMKSSSLLPRVGETFGRSDSFSAAPKPPAQRRRDSIVSQRVTAYNSSQDDIQLPMEVLAKFPAPPMPPVPRASMHKPLDPSKYSFTR